MSTSSRMLWLQFCCTCATNTLLSSASDLCNVMEEGNNAAQDNYAYIPELKCLDFILLNYAAILLFFCPFLCVTYC